MRGGMPAPAYAQVDPTGAVLPGAAPSPAVVVIPPPGRGRRALTLLILAGTVSVSGAATGYSASQIRHTPQVRPSARALTQSSPRSLPQALASPMTAAAVAVPLSRSAAAPSARPAVHPAEIPALVQRRMPVSVVVDGQVRQITTAARGSREVLAQAGVTLGPADRVFPSSSTPLWSGAKVRVVRIERVFTTRRVALPVPSVTVKDPALPRGMVRTDPGRHGVKVQRFLNELADGRLVSMTYLGQEVLRPSTPSVTRVGTKVLVASRGQFAGKEYLDMVATAYSPFCCKGVDDATAIGMRAGYGVVAVDPRVIPLRSRLYIEGYGYAVAGDTGGKIKGLRIDLGMDTLRAAKQFGRRPIRVYILEKGQPKKKKK